jgi:hypothetical protein
MHNGQLADPLNEWAKRISAVSSKRKKVESDLEEMAKLEFLGSLYLYDGFPCIPTEVIDACLTGRGGASRKVRAGASVQAGVFADAPLPLEYDGPRPPLELWEDHRFRLRVAAKIGQAKVMRTRPIFEQWSASGKIAYNPDLVNEQNLRSWLELAGAEVGIGDWRPKYGRFTVEFA